MNELHSAPGSEAPACQAPAREALVEESTTSSKPLFEADDLIEEISIDGMCGVY